MDVGMNLLQYYGLVLDLKNGHFINPTNNTYTIGAVSERGIKLANLKKEINKFGKSLDINLNDGQKYLN